jgi:hypothetical protein
MTQVATYSSDRTLLETNVDSPWERMALTFMWGARAAQYNVGANAIRTAWVKKDAASLKALASVMAGAVLAQTAGVTMVDTLRDKIRNRKDPTDEDVNEALKFSLGMAENILGTLPMSGEFMPAIFSQVYKAAGATDAAGRTAYRGQRGPLSSPVRNLSAILSSAEKLAKISKQMEEAKTPAQRRHLKQRGKEAVKTAGRSFTRLFSEVLGVPASQLMQVYQDIVGD